MRKSSSRSVTPYSGVNETGANVPCLKHFFRCLETSGSLIHDSKNGLIADTLDGSAGGSGAVTLNFNTSRKTLSLGADLNYRRFVGGGIWEPVANGSSVLNFMVARPTATGLKGAYGVGTSQNGITFSLVSASTASPNSHMIVGDAAGTGLGENLNQATQTTNNFGYVPDNTDCFVKQVWTPSGTFKTSIHNASTSLEYSSILKPTPTVVTGGFNPNDWMSWNADQEVYMWAIFHFTAGIPSDVDLACTWMAAEALRGNRVIWPGWIGLN